MLLPGQEDSSVISSMVEAVTPMSRSVSISVRPKERGRPSRSVLTGLAPRNHSQELRDQHTYQRDVAVHSQTTPQESHSKATILPQVPTIAAIHQNTPRKTRQTGRHSVFLKHITSISRIPLHYQLTKTFQCIKADPPPGTEPSKSPNSQPHIIHTVKATR